MSIAIKEYIFDGTFEGLLTSIFYTYTNTGEIKLTRSYNYIPNLLSTVTTINTEEDKFKRVYSTIRDKLSYSTLKNVYYLYLSDIDDVDTLILNYIKLCFRYGDKVNLAKNNDIILLVDKYYRRVSLEAHRFTGFVRFNEVGHKTFYSTIEPDHNIVSLLSSHFTKRFSDQKFIIHDTKRNLALVYDTKEAIITDFSSIDSDYLSSFKTSDEYEGLWKKFYNSVNIEERHNPRLQKRSMPTRYWKNLTELN